jgi:hypothetical protein
MIRYKKGSLAESSKEGYGSKRTVLRMMMMIMQRPAYYKKSYLHSVKFFCVHHSIAYGGWEILGGYQEVIVNVRLYVGARSAAAY